jgi:Holliday junction resolvasome RuvABC ATP-dependent DNA helicase subunit
MSESTKGVLDLETKPDDSLDTTLRPQALVDLIGQDQVKETWRY